MSEKSNSGTPPIITMDKKTKLKLCLFGNICLLFIVISLMFTFQSESKYCRIGPHDDLLILAYKVDTWNKYYIIYVHLKKTGADKQDNLKMSCMK